MAAFAAFCGTGRCIDTRRVGITLPNEAHNDAVGVERTAECRREPPAE